MGHARSENEMDEARLTPSQTIGPFFHDGLGWAVTPQDRPVGPLTNDEWRVVGRVLDADGEGVPDAMLEIWQPLASQGHDATAPRFQRIYTDEAGRFTFTIHQTRDEPAVAHVTIFARGLLVGLRTRMYAGGTRDQLAALEDLRRVPRERLPTLMPSTSDAERRTLEWSVRLQGARETVFFALT
jgi:protocatechuate 3,4-dioxygenase, alpha subunit